MFEYANLSPATRVANGVALLDQAEPGWWQSIDLHRLDQGSIENCVLGQTFGEYSAGCTALGRSEYSEDAYYNWSRYYGYNQNDTASNFNLAYEIDTDEWTRVILARCAGAVETVVPEVSEPVVINEFHLAGAQAIIAEAVQNHDTRIPGLSDAGTLLRILEALGVTGLVQA
jgi:hypothetical protein